MRIELLQPGHGKNELAKVSDEVVAGLAEVLLDAVAGGANVGFLAGLTQREAGDWWRAALRDPGLLTWVARDDGDRIVGTVGLVPVAAAAGAHRAEVTKFLVRREARGQGHGRALMAALETTASSLGRRLLLLDTETGSPAEGLYERWGWQRYGVVEGHAAAPDGRLTATTFLLKRL